MKPSKWTVVTRPSPGAAVRLFCFPYAGAGASVFRDWNKRLSSQIEVVAIQPPGRENRFSEPRCTRIDQVVHALRSVILDLSDKPFFFFGHSLGALVGFELTRALQSEGLPGPLHLVVSGMRAPQLARREEMVHLLDDASFLKRIGEFNGTPKDLLQDAELMKLYAPLLRDDFRMCETHTYRDGPLVRCPLTALGGTADDDVTTEDLAAWRAVASGTFEYYTFPGDHFFIHSNQGRILELLGLVGEREARSLDRLRVAASATSR